MLQQGSPLYILERGNTPVLKLGKCVKVQSNFSNYLPNSTVDLSVQIDNDTVEFKQLPSSLGIATYSGTTVISDSKDMMSQEVEGMIRTSKQILESIPTHEATVEEGEKILKQLNPEYAQQKEQEEKINNLETKMGTMESKLDDIATLLNKALKYESSRN